MKQASEAVKYCHWYPVETAPKCHTFRYWSSNAEPCAWFASDDKFAHMDGDEFWLWTEATHVMVLPPNTSVYPEFEP